jgi:hypothetical protein
MPDIKRKYEIVGPEDWYSLDAAVRDIGDKRIFTPIPPLITFELLPPSITYDSTLASSDVSLSPPSTTYESTLASSDVSLSPPSITYEYEVA